MKYEKVSNISSERSLQYEVYEPYNKTKLNLTICNEIDINIYIPVTLSEKTKNLYNELKDLGYDLFDINSEFYQDICTPYKSSNGTDVLLSDRVNYYYNNEETTCQSNCKFSDYLMESQYLKCDCDIKNSEINTQNSKQFNAKSIYQSFYNVLKYSNYKVLKCCKLTFNLKSLTNNKGSIITIAYFLIFSICFIIYCLNGIKHLKSDFSKNIMENEDKNKEEIKVPESIKENEKIENHNSLNKSKHRRKRIKKHKNNEQLLGNTGSKKRAQNIEFANPPKKNKIILKEIDSKSKINNLNNKYDNNDILITNRKNEIKNINHIDNIKENKKINKQIEDILIFNKDEKKQLDNYELNNLEYDSAKKIDKRNFIEIYWSKLK